MRRFLRELWRTHLREVLRELIKIFRRARDRLD